MIRPLEGLRILDLTRLLPGPFATLYLAQLGAEVVKVEDKPGADYARTLAPELFALLDRGKSSQVIDFKSDAGREELLREIDTADALVESFRPGAMAAWQLDYDTVHARNPRLVYGSLTGYGQTGPLRLRAGHDINYLGYAGVLEQMGRPGEKPSLINLQIADQAGGSLTFALGIVSALLRARTTGEGCHVDVAMTDASMALMVNALAGWNTQGSVPARGLDPLSGGLPNYDVYRCADGRYIALGALEPKFWAAFCEAVERPDLLATPLGVGEAGAPVRDALTELFATRNRDDWARVLEPVDACATPVLSLDEAFEHDQLVARGVPVEHEGRRYLACPIHFRR